MNDHWLKGVIDNIKKGNVKYYKVGEPLANEMFMFNYDAKYKYKLPVWDRYPLTLILHVDGTHMFGINIHFLPIRVRRDLISAIVDRRVLSYDILKAFTSHEFLKHAVKKYLISHVKSRMVRVDRAEWKNVIYLPQQPFVTKK